MAPLRSISLALIFLLIGGCAQLPQSSVTLSNSISDDLASMQKSHKDFINFYYDGLEQQANNLIDTKYRPSLIRQVIEQDVERFKSPEKKHQSLFNAIQVAFIDNQSLGASDLETAQSNAMAGMNIFYTKIDKKVETERNKLIAPLREQRQQLAAAVDANYSNIIKKNSAVSALLSSVVDVHEAQQQLFSMAGVQKNIREEAGIRLSRLAEKISEIQGSVNEKSSQAQDVENAIKKFRELISN